MEKAYLICPVRNVREKDKKRIEKLLELYSDMYEIHSFANVDQNDPTGYYIVDSHQEAIKKSDVVLIYWDSFSQGSIFDLGMAIALEKRIKFIGCGQLSTDDLNKKSYYKVAKLIERFGYHRSITPDYPDWSAV